METERDDAVEIDVLSPKTASALWLVTILLDDMSDYLAVRLTAPTVEDIVSYERRQAWVANFIEVVQARAAEGGCCYAP